MCVGLHVRLAAGVPELGWQATQGWQSTVRDRGSQPIFSQVRNNWIGMDGMVPDLLCAQTLPGTSGS